MEIEFENNIMIKSEPSIDLEGDNRVFVEDQLEMLETQHMQFLDPSKRLQFLREAGLSNLEDKPFRCDICDKCFKRKSHLTRHRLLHTGLKPFSCDICQERFTRSENRQRHIMQMHHEGSQYRCNVCQKVFSKVHSMKRHMKSHDDDRPFVCDICGNRYFRSDKLAAHKLTHILRTDDDDDDDGRKFACDVCDKRFTRKDHMQRHKAAHTGIKLHECAYCSKRFSRKDNQVKHQTTCTASKLNQVESNSTSESNTECLKTEISMNAGNASTSILCTQNTIQSINNQIQSNNVTNKMPSSRDGAVEIFLVQNTNSKENQGDGLDSNQPYAEQDHIDRNECEPAKNLNISTSFSGASGSSTQKPVFPGYTVITTDTGDQYLKCSMCEKQFRHKHHLQRHQYVHLGIKPFKCDQCDRAFTRKEHLNRHYAVHIKHDLKIEQNDGPYIFSNAGTLSLAGIQDPLEPNADDIEFFNQNLGTNDDVIPPDNVSAIDENSGNYVSSLLEISMASSTAVTPASRVDVKSEDDQLLTDWREGNDYTELETKPLVQNDRSPIMANRYFPCDKCDKVFYKQFLLARHYTRHTGEKRFKCQICNRGFTRLEHQKRHMATHSNDRKYECDLCDRKFSRTDHLLAHMKSSHAGFKPYPCPMNCGQRFDTFREKTLHIRECSHYCDTCNLSFTSKSELDYHQQTHEQICLDEYEITEIKSEVMN